MRRQTEPGLMNSTGNKLKVNAASEDKLNSHEQGCCSRRIKPLNQTDVSLICGLNAARWMEWITLLITGLERKNVAEWIKPNF